MKQTAIQQLKSAIRILGDLENEDVDGNEQILAKRLGCNDARSRQILRRLEADGQIRAVDSAHNIFRLTFVGISAYDEMTESPSRKFLKYSVGRAELVLTALITTLLTLSAERILNLKP